MARSKYNRSIPSSASGQAYVQGLKKRVARFSEFPIGSEISYSWDDESLGTVVNYDQQNGRVLTDKGGSHPPDDIKVLRLNTQKGG